MYNVVNGTSSSFVEPLAISVTGWIMLHRLERTSVDFFCMK